VPGQVFVHREEEEVQVFVLRVPATTGWSAPTAAPVSSLHQQKEKKLIKAKFIVVSGCLAIDITVNADFASELLCICK
jgi:hypothetical protein